MGLQDTLQLPGADRFWNAIIDHQFEVAIQLLRSHPEFAVTNFKPDSRHTEGFALYHAAEHGHLELAQLLLESGADPNAAIADKDPREFGMPLMNAFHQGQFAMVDLLLDHGANVFAFSYCGTPFVDCLYNSTRDEPAWRDLVNLLVRGSFAHYLGDDSSDKSAITDRQVKDRPRAVALLHRAIKQGGHPTLFTVARHAPMQLVEDLLKTSATRPGTKLDWPQGSVFENLCYGASWTGQPDVLELCMKICPSLFTSDVAKRNIYRAIHSHNRDGDYPTYRRLIETQLQFLRDHDQLTETYSTGQPFLPLHWLVSDFIETSHYGFDCEDLLTTRDQIDLAKLFLRFEYEHDTIDPATDKSLLSLAIDEGQLDYADFLKSIGAT